LHDLNACDRTVADLHSFLSSNLVEVGVSGQPGPRPLFKEEPQQKRTLGGPQTWSGSFRKLKTPWTMRERYQERSLIQPVARPLHELQFVIISTSALQNTTPYPAILRYQRWKQQKHT